MEFLSASSSSLSSTAAAAAAGGVAAPVPDIGYLAAPPPLLAARFPGVTLLSARHLPGGIGGASTSGGRYGAAASVLLDRLGEASAAAQGLPGAITSGARLSANPDQRVYVAYEGGTPLGFIKVGAKTLFVTAPAGGDAALTEIRPLCVLDFFVVAARRRKGVGRLLFDAMVANEGVTDPASLAYDRPSAMFLAFLARHFGLSAYTPQANNYVVFHAYWTRRTGGGGLAGSAPGSRGAGAYGPGGGDACLPPPSAAAAGYGTPVAPRHSGGGGGGGGGTTSLFGSSSAAAGGMAGTPSRAAPGGRGGAGAATAPFATAYNDGLAVPPPRPGRRSPDSSPRTTISLAHDATPDGGATDAPAAVPRRTASPSHVRATLSTRIGPDAALASGWRGPGGATGDRVGLSDTGSSTGVAGFTTALPGRSGPYGAYGGSVGGGGGFGGAPASASRRPW